VPIEDVGRFEADFLDFVRRSHPGIYDSIRETSDLKDETATALKDAVEEFRRGFEVSGGGLLVPEEPAEPLTEDQVGQEKVPRYVPPATDNSGAQS
jgi:F-type H+-transporting ATPase subunit alpha